MTSPGGKSRLAQTLGPAAETMGIPTRLLEKPDFPTHLAFATASAFSEGEITYNHPPFNPDHAVLREQFGEKCYVDGELGSRLQEYIAADDPRIKEAAAAFVGLGARLFAEKVVANGTVLPSAATVTVHKKDRKLAFHNHEHVLQFDPKVVVDYGPGLAGRFHIDRQLADLHHHRATYQYYGFAQGIFVPEFLRHYLRLQGRQYPHAADAIRQTNLNTILDQGIEGSAHHLTPPFEAKGRNGGFVDIVIASGIHSAGEAALNGIRQARGLLKRNGVLLVRDINEPIEEDPGVSMNAMIEAGLAAGFRSGRMRRYDLTVRSPQGGVHEGRAIVMQK